MEVRYGYFSLGRFRGSYQKEIYQKEFQKEISKLRRTVNLYMY